MKSRSIIWMYHDEWSREFTVNINYVDNQPGIELESWSVACITDYTFDCRHGVEIKIVDSTDATFAAWLEQLVETHEKEIEALCAADIWDRQEAARERHEDELFERARLGE